MKKYREVILVVICVCISAALVFQVHLVRLWNGEQMLVYVPLSHHPGGSVGADLKEQLVPLYGGDDVEAEGTDGSWQGKDAVVYDIPSYEFSYLGRAFGGGDYLACKVTTTRTVILDGESLPATTRESLYLGYDDTDPRSVERAKILWESLQEDYSDSEEYFHQFLPKGHIGEICLSEWFS